MHALADLAGIAAGRPDPGDAPPLEDDLLILAPGAAVHIEQSADPQRAIGRAPAERRQHQVLADANLVGRVDQEVVGDRIHGLPHSTPVLSRAVVRLRGDLPALPLLAAAASR